jgi:transposase
MDISLTNLLNLPGVFVEYCDYREDCLYFYLRILSDAIYCLDCCAYIEELHQVRVLIVRDLPAFGRDVYLHLPRRQFYCRACQRYTTERLEFIDWRRKYTRRYEENIYLRVNNSNIQNISLEENLSIEDIKKIFNYIRKKQNKE